MAFGTGHHSTTELLKSALPDNNPAGKTVVDFGCGSGVPGILAGKMNAGKMPAMDNDIVVVENAKENLC